MTFDSCAPDESASECRLAGTSPQTRVACSLAVEATSALSSRRPEARWLVIGMSGVSMDSVRALCIQGESIESDVDYDLELDVAARAQCSSIST